jgi:5-formyltetrahydrofolate cyclo-ligase
VSGDEKQDEERHSHALAAEDVIRFKVKAELRKRLRSVRRMAPIEACADRSAKIVAALESLASVRQAKQVALFWPMLERHEVDLRALDQSLRARGVRVAYPAIDPGTDEMRFAFVDDPAGMPLSELGFAEPPPGSEPARELDVVVVPAIALDPTGHRIGYGAGYYDRALPSVSPPAVSIGVAYDYQLVAEVPATAGDVRVGWVVTDMRVVEAVDR